MWKKKKEEPKKFKYNEVNKGLLNNCPDFDINSMYARVFEELGTQQTKRDQLITIYLAAFAFIVPPLLEAENINLNIIGSIFIILGIIGLLFALIIIRYRKYKEVYWICCRTINVLMDIDKSQWKKENIQAIFYECLCKNVKSYVENNKFKTFNFVINNFFSSETLYLVIHSIISSCVFGLGVGIVLPFAENFKFLLGIIAGLILFVYCVFVYFRTLKNIYTVCVDGLDASFNATFKDAWFLHFFI